MELKDTIALMESKDYKDRFKAEYFQLKIRYEKLNRMLEKWRNGELDFEPTCPYKMFEEQLNVMWKYSCVLGMRAQLEGIDLVRNDCLEEE